MADIKLFGSLSAWFSQVSALFLGLFIGIVVVALKGLAERGLGHHPEREQILRIDLAPWAGFADDKNQIEEKAGGLHGHRQHEVTTARQWLIEEVVADESLDIG